MSTRLPWHQCGFRVHKAIYRGWYICQFILGVFILASAVAPVVLLALSAIASALEFTLTAIAAAVMSLIGALVLCLAIHRLRNPVKPIP